MVHVFETFTIGIYATFVLGSQIPKRDVEKVDALLHLAGALQAAC